MVDFWLPSSQVKKKKAWEVVVDYESTFFSSGGQKPPKFLQLGAQALESTDVKDSVIISLRETDLTDYFSARA